jgi:hypothetical protein
MCWKAVATLIGSTYARHSESVAIQVEDLDLSPDKDDGLVRLRRYKGDPAGKGAGYAEAGDLPGHRPHRNRRTTTRDRPVSSACHTTVWSSVIRPTFTGITSVDDEGQLP